MQWQSSKINWPTLPFSLFNVCSNLISIFISFECFLSLLPLHMCTEFIANLCFPSTSYRQGGCYQNISAYLSLIWRNRVDRLYICNYSVFMTAAVEMFPLSPQVIQQRGAFDLSPDTRLNFTRSWEVRSRPWSCASCVLYRASNEPSRGFHNQG